MRDKIDLKCYLNKAPDEKLAVIWTNSSERQQTMTYGELREKIYQRANYFHTLELKNKVVGVLAPRGPEYLINMLALWQIGAVYLPLSGAWREKNAIANRLIKSGATCLLTVKESQSDYQTEIEKWTQHGRRKTVCMDSLALPSSSNFSDDMYVQATDNAYIFSSSGTTAEPKLIALPHAGILDRIDDHVDYMRIGSGDGVLGFIDFGFDASVVEMLIAMRTGNTFFITPESARGEQSYQALPAFIQQHAGEIHVAILLPSVLKGLKPAQCPGLNKIVTMGESCLLSQLQKDGWFEQAEIYNGYGPTETTFGASLTRLEKTDKDASIHRPMKGITLYLRESFGLLFASAKDKIDTEKDKIDTKDLKDPDVFYLSYSVSKATWRYDIAYSLDSQGIPTQGKLPRDLYDLIEKAKASDAKTDDAKKAAKEAESQLLEHLINSTVGIRRIIAKTQGKTLCADGLGKTYFIHDSKENKKSIQGEIVIAGTGIGTYLGLPKKVQEKFRTQEMAQPEGFAEERVFISGDIAEFDGVQLIYKNRNDNQIKRYGMLVTLDEIEAALRTYEEIIKDVVVMARESTVIACMVPRDDKIFVDDSRYKAVNEALSLAIYQDKPMDIKLRPNTYLWVEKIPQTERNKASRNIDDYKAIKPKRALQENVKIQDIDEQIRKLSKIWQDLLEGGAKVLELEGCLYDPNKRFDELGGDSLLTSQMIQQVWKLHTEKDTPAPNDFSRGIVENPTLEGISQFLACYGQKVSELSAGNEGFPIFIFDEIGVNKAAIQTTGPLYQFSFPEVLQQANAKIQLLSLKHQCRNKVDKGPYHLICSQTYQTLAKELARALADLGEDTHLVVVKDSSVDRVFLDEKKENKMIASKTPQISEYETKQHLSIYHTDITLLPELIQKLHKEGIQAVAGKNLIQIRKDFFSTSDKSPTTPQPVNPIELAKNTTHWFIGTAGEGKSRSLKDNLGRQCNAETVILPLDIRGLRAANIFECALEKHFPRWQWVGLREYLQKNEKNTWFVVEDYDATGRIDCPNLWEQAKSLGFDVVGWLLTCQTSYWQVCQGVVREFAGGNMIHSISHRVSSELIALMQPLGFPPTSTAEDVYKEVKKKLPTDAKDFEIHYAFLVEWFKCAYEYYGIGRYERALSEKDYVQEAFQTLKNIYEHYITDTFQIDLALEPSHWELQKKLPCIHALPAFNAVFSLFNLQSVSPQLSVHIPYTLEEYEALSKKLGDSDLMLIRHPENKNWYWRYRRLGTAQIEEQVLFPWMVKKLKKHLLNHFFCKDESALTKSINKISSLIKKWHPLQYAIVPQAWKDEVCSYVDHYEKTCREAENQGLSAQDIRVCHNKVGDNFWGNLGEKARYHVLPLQHVPGSIPIFIFHPLTGETPICYRSLAEALGPHQSVYALQMKVDDDYTDCYDKAKLYYDYIIKIQKNGPYILMGWSFGGILAYYVAFLLEQKGHQVDNVINFDSPPPQLISQYGIDKRALDMIEVLAHKIYQVPLNIDELKSANVATSHSTPAVNANRYFDAAIKQMGASKNPDKKISERATNFCHALQKARYNLQVYHDFATWCAKKNPKIKATCTIFEATQEKSPYLNDTDFKQWQSYCVKPIELHKISGTHFTLFNAELFNVVRPLLDRYQCPQQLTLEERLKKYKKARQKAFRLQKKEAVKGIYIEAMADKEQAGKKPFLLEKEVNEFLNQPDTNCFLLQGDPGSGKSHYGLQLESKIWKSGSYFPLWIALRPHGKDYVKTALLSSCLLKDEYEDLMAALKTSKNPEETVRQYLGAPLLVIFDGYDEALTQDNLYQQEGLHQWSAKAFISCRSYAVNFRQMYEQFGDHEKNVKTAYLQPFSVADIELYLNCYYAKTGIALDLKKWEAMTDKNLIQNPLLLSIALILWEDLPTYQNRAALYQAFFDKLYRKDAKKVRSEEGKRSRVRLIKAFKGYNQKKALQYWQRDINKLTPLMDNEVLPSNQDTQQARASNRLGIDSEGRISHITFWEYQLACAIVEVVLAQDFSEVDTAYPALLGEGSFCENLSLLTMVKELSETKKLSSNRDRLIHHLLLTVYGSRHIHSDTEKDRAKVFAASNAISILNVMRVPFSGLDFREIRVPGAYLNGALFDHTCLEYADLSNAKLGSAVLCYTDLSAANLKGADFKRLVFSYQESVQKIAISPDKQFLAVAIGRNIEIRSLKNRADDKKEFALPIVYKLSILEKVTSIVFSPNGKFFASGTKGGKLSVWNVAENFSKSTDFHKHDFKLENEIKSIIFLPDKENLHKKILLATSSDIYLIDNNFSQSVKKIYTNESKRTSFYINDVLFNEQKDDVIISGSVSPDEFPEDTYAAIQQFNLADPAKVSETDFRLGSESYIAMTILDRNNNIFAAVGGAGYEEHSDGNAFLFLGTDINKLSFEESLQENRFESACFSSDGKIIALGSLNKIYLRRTLDGTLHSVMSGHKESINCLLFIPESDLLISASNDNTLCVWNINTNSIAYPGHQKNIVNICFKEDGHTLISQDKNTICIWDIAQGTQTSQIICNDEIDQFLLSAEQDILLLKRKHYPTGEIDLISERNRQVIGSLPGNLIDVNDNKIFMVDEYYPFRVQEDSDFDALQSFDQTMRIYQVNNEKKIELIKKFKTTHYDYTVFSPDLSQFACISNNRDRPSITLISEMSNPEVIVQFDGHEARINCLRYSQDSKHLASASEDGTVRIWDAKNYQLTAVLKHFYAVWAVAFSNNGIIAASSRESIFIWSPIPGVNYMDYQITGIYSKSYDFFISNVFFQKADINYLNRNFLSQYAANSSKSDSRLVKNFNRCITSEQIKKLKNPTKHFPFQDFPLEIFYEQLLPYFSDKDWLKFSLVSKFFWDLQHVTKVLAFNMLPRASHQCKKSKVRAFANNLKVTHEDAYNQTHSLIWPLWIFKSSESEQLKTVEPVFNHTRSDEKIMICFQESSWRRLLYQVSTAYLLSEGIQVAIQLGLHLAIGKKTIPLYRLYEFLPDCKEHLIKRLIRFLSQHAIVHYDSTSEEVALTMVGSKILDLTNLDEETEKKYAFACEITLQEFALSIQGHALEIICAFSVLGKLAKLLHQPEIFALFDDIGSDQNTILQINQKFSDLKDQFDLFIHFKLLVKKGEEFELTDLGRRLSSAHPQTLQPTLAMLNQNWWSSLNRFTDMLQKGVPAFELANRISFFEYLSKHREEQVRFNEGLACLTQFQDEIIIQKLHESPFCIKAYKSIVDIASGAGGLLKAIQAYNPNQSYDLTLYDQPSVIAHGQSKNSIEIQKWQWASGSFFDPPKKNNIPCKQDAYFIKGTLHDFDDTQCLTVLSHIREAMAAKSHLYVIERTLHDTGQPHINDYGDLLMMMLLEGRGRHSHEWLKLFLQAGFTWLNELMPLEADDHTIMVCKVQQPEISRSLSFFKIPIQKREEAYQKRVQRLMMENDNISQRYVKPVCALRKLISANRFKDVQEKHCYDEDYMNLLCNALNPNEDSFMMLPVVTVDDLVNVNFDLSAFDRDYYCLPIANTDHGWSALFIDRWRNVVFYVNPTHQPTPEVIKTFIGQRCKGLDESTKLISLTSDTATKTPLAKHSGPYLIALLANMIEKIQRNDAPSRNDNDLMNWLMYAEKLISYENTAIEFLPDQQLRWAVDYLTEKLADPYVRMYQKRIQHWGDFQIKQITKHTFGFFDSQTLRATGCINRGFRVVQLELELEKSVLNASSLS